ncbi:flagellar motor stator protein MotA [Pseudidiomarina andamanensis]|uniref:Flagellar motor stator protein MotA n=1 Tax=Pseudidiomarina andamanensis TaxID=1940690 RepID=A0AA92EVY7_9GAMM|nr:flagellar motor stator protein MotA [Pseudidiomarina andamanensis]MDS0218917.1 flagellar motor stator protein MotA [Pseudidiomarina andamanensis]PHR66694.1 MAG: flagellar motor stator protein MotA [Idiomarina sp.]QGT96280.1 flagellar motor stator protein MotA [Pseudidiomarina andamanensis]
MLIAIGFVVVLLSVFGGFVLAGGALGPIFQPLELLIIGGAGIGSFIAANNGKAIKATLQSVKRFKRSTQYNSETYLELLAVIYKLLNKMRRDGMLAVERDIENPEESAIFQEHPDVLEDTMMLNFIADYLRLMISGNMNPQELDELMLHEIETFEAEAEIPGDALHKVGDAMPAFGIVAAVLGVVRALSTADVPPDVMGTMIAHALVGTFLGILLGYGFINPLASRVERQVAELVKTLQVIRVTLLASMHGYAPQLAVEFGRKALHTSERPTFTELEDHVRGAKAES